MPTSNGLITSRDIRQDAVKTVHILDDAIVTSKIPDLAVTFPDKIDDPTWVRAFFGVVFQNTTLTTSVQTYSIVVDVPAWVDALSVLAIGALQMTNTSGSTVELIADVDIETASAGAWTVSIPNNSVGQLRPLSVTNVIGVAGSSITVSVDVRLSSGTNASNFGSVYGIAIGRR